MSPLDINISLLISELLEFIDFQVPSKRVSISFFVKSGSCSSHEANENIKTVQQSSQDNSRKYFISMYIISNQCILYRRNGHLVGWKAHGF